MLIQNCKVEKTPTEKFPQMVTITSKCKKYESLWGKKYITLEQAEKQIMMVFVEGLIGKQNSKLKKLHDEFLLEESW